MNASQLGGNAPPSIRTLRDLFENEYRPLRLVGRSQRTLVLFRYTLKQFGLYLGREPTLDDLQDLTLGNYLQYLIDLKRAKASVNKERRQLVAIWNFAARRRYVGQFPEIPPVPEPERIPKAWTTGDLQRIAAACRTAGQFTALGTYEGIPAADWWLALHAVLWDTGERIKAILQLQWTDLSGDWLTVPAEYRKGSKRPMQFKLRLETVELLEAIRRPSGEIFPWPFSATYVYFVYKKILKTAGVEYDRQSKFHRMRRSVASHIAAAGGNPSLALGHSNPATTARYLDPKIARSVPISEVLPSFIEQEK
jgi:integrase